MHGGFVPQCSRWAVFEERRLRAHTGSALERRFADAARRSIKTSAAPQRQKQPFVQGAARFRGPMSGLRCRFNRSPQHTSRTSPRERSSSRSFSISPAVTVASQEDENRPSVRAADRSMMSSDRTTVQSNSSALHTASDAKSQPSASP